MALVPGTSGVGWLVKHRRYDGFIGLVLGWTIFRSKILHSLKLTAKAPESRSSQKETIVFQLAIFRCKLAISFREGSQMASFQLKKGKKIKKNRVCYMSRLKITNNQTTIVLRPKRWWWWWWWWWWWCSTPAEKGHPSQTMHHLAIGGFRKKLASPKGIFIFRLLMVFVSFWRKHGSYFTPRLDFVEIFVTR